MILLMSTLILLCITGCHNHKEEEKENIYLVDYDTTIENYQSLSDIGNDYLIPKLSDEYWNEFKVLDKKCQVAESKNGKTSFYIIRDTDISNNKEYIEQLGSVDIVNIIHKIAKSYLGNICINKKNVNYINDIKYIDVKGTVGNKNCYMSCFQSHCEVPSVSITYVPTAYIIVYDQSDDEENVMDMIQTIKEWTIRFE